MKVLVIGSGGREHAIAWKLSLSKKIDKLFCAPGNPGTQEMCENVQIAVDDIDNLVKFAKENQIDLTVIGPEYPLTLGIVDEFKKEGLRVFGPTKAAAQIEGSKSFSKEIMDAAGVPTAKYKSVSNKSDLEKVLAELGSPIVIKNDGLAAGKGVFVCLNDQ
ncbi:MAG: ATP-grasp domain-containing protein, partial [Bdellovibrionales bacterium]|nr:ATP-grasp domain-containing protein [Bdellovibrionales bacterium]